MSKEVGKIRKVVAMLEAGEVTVKTLIAEGGISKATAYSLPYYLGKQGYSVVKGQNEAKEVTYHINGAQNKKVKALAKEVVAEAVAGTELVVEAAAPSTAKPRKAVKAAMAVKPAKKRK